MGTMVGIFEKSHGYNSCLYVAFGKSHFSLPLHTTCLIFSCWRGFRVVEYIIPGDAAQHGYMH